MSSDQENNSDLFDGFGNGSLHMYVVCTPGWKPYEDGDRRYLDLDFHGSDWEALFLKALGAHEWQLLPSGDYPSDYDQDQRRKFYESLPNLPRLRTIYDMYEDYVFDVYEAAMLREECIRLRGELTGEPADRALRKLIYGCDKAIESKCSLMFVCD